MNVEHNNQKSLIPSLSNCEKSKKSQRDEHEEPPQEFQNLKRMKFTTEEMEPDFSANLLGSESHLNFISLLNSNSQPEDCEQVKQSSPLDTLNENPNMFREKQLEQEIHTLYKEEVTAKKQQIIDQEEENSRLELESQFLSNSLNEISQIKKGLIDQFNEIISRDDYENFIYTLNYTQIHINLWKSILSEGEIKTVPLTFITNDENTITISFPLSLWKFFSEVFGTAATTSMRNTSFIEHVSGESLQLFFQCLQENQSENIIDLDHLEDIWALAQKYMIPWLAKDCGEYFEKVYKPKKKFFEELENLKIATTFQNEHSARSSIISLCKLIPDLWESLNKKDAGDGGYENSFIITELKDLEDQFADLKLLLTLSSWTKILPDNSVNFDFKNEDINNIQTCLTINNPWYSPMIQISFHETLNEDLARELNKILAKANTSITLKLYRLDLNLIDFLQNNPKIEKLRLVIDCTLWKDDQKLHILELIEKNTTLKSLHLTLNRYDNGLIGFNPLGQSRLLWNWPGINENENFIIGQNRANKSIKNALEKNMVLRDKEGISDMECVFIQSNLVVNELSTYTNLATIDNPNWENIANYPLYPYIQANHFYPAK